METNHVCIIKLGSDEESYGLMSVKDGETWTIRGFRSEAEGLEYFESSYRRFHQRGYESSMSASLNWMYFQASIVKLSIPEIETIIKERKVVQARNVAGRVDVIPLIVDKAKDIWEKGSKPTLIKDEWLR